MHRTSAEKSEHVTRRSARPSLNPYFMEEIGLTLADVQRARSGAFESSLTDAR